MNELTINLDAESKRPLYEQIYEYIKFEIQKGNLSSDEKLPSARALASHLQVSRSTIDLAYSQLVSEGYVEAVPCKGYFVNQMEALYFPGQYPKKEFVENNLDAHKEQQANPEPEVLKAECKVDF